MYPVITILFSNLETKFLSFTPSESLLNVEIGSVTVKRRKQGRIT